MGCGSGIVAKELLEDGFKVLGIDKSEALIQIAKKHAPQGKYEVGSFFEASFPKCMGVIPASECLNYATNGENKNDLKDLFKSIFASLQKGGLFSITNVKKIKIREFAMFGSLKIRLLLALALSFGSLSYADTEIDLRAAKFEGAEFVLLDNGYKVWTKRVGHGPIKILTLHGGPGYTHEYLECMEKYLPQDKYQIIFYDQLGSYYSDQPNDPTLWTIERFSEEIEQVRKALGLEEFYLYGHSWGGVLAIEYSLKYQEHLKGVILAGITASADSYVTHFNELISKLPSSIKDKLKFYEDAGDIHNPDYEKLLFDEVYSKYLCRLQPWPDSLLRSFRHLNHQVYNVIQGPNEYIIIGNSKDWNRWADLPKITIPTLLICGRYDTMDPKDLEKMGALIPNSRKKICENGSHCAFYDDPESYFDAICTFLNDTETH